ncbi:MAG: AAA family ATPase [Bacilli bacterium]|nr:AAA family ATPase [Bacilli bacterium]MDD4407155.1 AAA family ATPase [Bacilli bacterium]
MNKCYNAAVNKILNDAEKEMLVLKHPYVGTEHLLLSLLKKEKIKNICNKYNLTYHNFKTELLNIVGSSSKQSEIILYTPLLKLIINKAFDKSYDDKKELNEIYLFSSLINENEGIALRIIDNMGIDLKELNKELTKPKIAYELGINLNDKEIDKILLREKEIEEVMQILLRRNKNNPLLIGKAGVGKTAIVEELARRIKFGEVPDNLKNKEIILINTSTLIAGTKYRGEFEERVNNLIKEVINNKNVILFIDEIHNIVKTGASDGSIDAANILKPYLARGDLSIIGATTVEEYNEFIKKDSALNRRFATIKVNEPTNEDMKFILMKIKKGFEEHYNLKISKESILYLINMADDYFQNLYNPDKCIDILDSVCSKKVLDNFNKNNKDNKIREEDIKKIIFSRINLHHINKEKIDNIKGELLSKYNEQILKNVLNIIKDNKPNKYMILSGADRKKKEELIKVISKKLFINLINVDCTEFNDEYSLNKLIANNYLYDQINENPYSIILFNNYECANKVLFNLINTMINNGYITNNRNEKLLLNNIVIFILDNKTNSSIGFNNKKHLLFAN